MNENLELHALADGELTAEESKRLQQAILADPKLSAELEAIRQLKQVLRSKTQVFESADTWKKTRRQLDEIDSSRRVNSFVTKYAWGFCSVFLVLIIGAGLSHRLHPGSSVKANDMAYMASILPSSGSSSASDARRAVEQLSVQGAPELHPERLSVQHVAQGIIDGRQVIRFDVTEGQGQLVLLCTPGDFIDGAQNTGHRSYGWSIANGLRCVTWTDNGVAMMLMGDRSVDELCAIADTITTGQR